MFNKFVTFKSDNKWGYIIIYLFLLFKTGWYFYSNKTGITSPILFFVVLLLGHIRNKKLQATCILPCLLIFVFQIVTYIGGGVPGSQYVIGSLLDFAIAIVIVSIFTRKRFLEIFSDWTLIFCVVSIIALAVNYLAPSALSVFPAIDPTSRTRFALLTTIPGAWSIVPDSARIQGINWEPGAFQFFINLSLIINYYREYKNKREKLLRAVLYYVTLILTYSTTGIACGAIIFILYFSQNKKIKTIAVPLYIGIIIAGYVYMSTRTEGYIHYALYQKVEDATNYQYGDDNSSSVRVESIIYPMKHIIEEPLIGMSQAEVASYENIVGHTMLTCTIVNYFSYYGVLSGLLCVFLLYRFVRTFSGSQRERLIIAFALILSTSTEQLAYNCLLSVFMLYGYLSGNFKRKIKGYDRTIAVVQDK